MSTTITTWAIWAFTPGARWAVATGLSSREAADKALTAIVAQQGLRATDASGRLTAVTFGIAEE